MMTYAKDDFSIDGRYPIEVTVVTDGTSNVAKYYKTLSELKRDYPVGTRGRNVYFNYK